MNRAAIAHYANRIGLESRSRGAPILRANSSVDQLIAWLKWNDPNGDYDGTSGEFEPLTLDEAWDLVADAVKEEAEADGYDSGGGGALSNPLTGAAQSGFVAICVVAIAAGIGYAVGKS
jgi:hypothetical protein